MKLMAIRISKTPLLYNHKKMLDKKTNFGVWNASQFGGGGGANLKITQRIYLTTDFRKLILEYPKILYG